MVMGPSVVQETILMLPSSVSSYIPAFLRSLLYCDIFIKVVFPVLTNTSQSSIASLNRLVQLQIWFSGNLLNLPPISIALQFMYSRSYEVQTGLHLISASFYSVLNFPEFTFIYIYRFLPSSLNLRIAISQFWIVFVLVWRRYTSIFW